MAEGLLDVLDFLFCGATHMPAEADLDFPRLIAEQYMGLSMAGGSFICLE